jgi:hypothetical protein
MYQDSQGDDDVNFVFFIFGLAISYFENIWYTRRRQTNQKHNTISVGHDST